MLGAQTYRNRLEWFGIPERDRNWKYHNKKPRLQSTPSRRSSAPPPLLSYTTHTNGVWIWGPDDKPISAEKDLSNVIVWTKPRTTLRVDVGEGRYILLSLRFAPGEVDYITSTPFFDDDAVKAWLTKEVVDWIGTLPPKPLELLATPVPTTQLPQGVVSVRQVISVTNLCAEAMDMYDASGFVTNRIVFDGLEVRITLPTKPHGGRKSASISPSRTAPPSRVITVQIASLPTFRLFIDTMTIGTDISVDDRDACVMFVLRQFAFEPGGSFVTFDSNARAPAPVAGGDLDPFQVPDPAYPVPLHFPLLGAPSPSVLPELRLQLSTPRASLPSTPTTLPPTPTTPGTPLAWPTWPVEPGEHVEPGWGNVMQRLMDLRVV